MPWMGPGIQCSSLAASPWQWCSSPAACQCSRSSLVACLHAKKIVFARCSGKAVLGPECNLHMHQDSSEHGVHTCWDEGTKASRHDLAEL